MKAQTKRKVSKPASSRTRKIMDYPFKGTISEARIKKAVKTVMAILKNNVLLN